jgi:hypothetical protein
MRAANKIPLECPLPLTGCTFYDVTTRKVPNTVLNAFRRPVVIFGSVFLLGSPISTVNVVGVILACAGVGGYSYFSYLNTAGTKT